MVRQPILLLAQVSNLILQKQIEFTCKNNMEEEKSCQDVLSLKPFGKMSCLISYKWYHMKYVGSWNIIAFFKILDSRHKNDKFVRHYIMLLQKCWTTKSQFYGSGALFLQVCQMWMEALQNVITSSTSTIAKRRLSAKNWRKIFWTLLSWVARRWLSKLENCRWRRILKKGLFSMKWNVWRTVLLLINLKERRLDYAIFGWKVQKKALISKEMIDIVKKPSGIRKY